ETKPLVEKVKKYIEKYCLVNDLPDIDDLGVTEGSLKIRRHLVRERNLSIIKQKKQKILSDFGKLECEVCHFDFEKNYGEIGKEFCEVHHLIPLNQS
ncbi:HNH endonuclease, partial [Acinetobacter baumannii]